MTYHKVRLMKFQNNLCDRGQNDKLTKNYTCKRIRVLIAFLVLVLSVIDGGLCVKIKIIIMSLVVVNHFLTTYASLWN